MSPYFSIERQEVWRQAWTYLRSKTARMEESDFSATAYQTGMALRATGDLQITGKNPWPPAMTSELCRTRTGHIEPELALVVNPRGELVGYSVGNDMSSRDRARTFLSAPGQSLQMVLLIRPVHRDRPDWQEVRMVLKKLSGRTMDVPSRNRDP